jgi:heme/copper-type cytochrome/quinol oxidase subunit 4
VSEIDFTLIMLINIAVGYVLSNALPLACLSAVVVVVVAVCVQITHKYINFMHSRE